MLWIKACWLGRFSMKFTVESHRLVKLEACEGMEDSVAHLLSMSMPSQCLLQLQPLSPSSQPRSLCFAMFSL